MKYSVAILALAAAVSAQQIDACDGKAQKCIEEAMEEAGVCEDPKDWACGCEHMDEVQSKATTCVIEACGGATDARTFSPQPHTPGLTGDGSGTVSY